MNHKDCRILETLWIGRVVYRLDRNENEPENVGHVAGFSRNYLDEVTVMVRWSLSKEVRTVHPSRICTEYPYEQEPTEEERNEND